MDTIKKNALVYAEGFIDGFIENFITANQNKTPQLKEYCEQIQNQWAIVSKGVTELVKENNFLIQKIGFIKIQVDT